MSSSHQVIPDHVVSQNWALFPSDAKPFILENAGKMTVQKLIEFWTEPSRIECFVDHKRLPQLVSLTRTVSNLQERVSALYTLANYYLRQNELAVAKALILNAGFYQQCLVTDIKCVTRVFNEIHSQGKLGALQKKLLPYIQKSCDSIGSPLAMEQHLKNNLKVEEDLNKSTVNRRSALAKWNHTESKHKGKRRADRNTQQGIQVLFDDGQKNITFKVSSNSTLKSLVAMYAEASNRSLRSFLVSLNGKTIFLSSNGNRTLQFLGVRDQDVFTIRTLQEEKENDTSQPIASKASTNKKSKKASSKAKSKLSKKSKSKSKVPPPEKTPTLEECMFEHSGLLTRVFEEAEPKFRILRKQLNDMNLERSDPKSKGKPIKVSSDPKQPISNPATDGLGGKAGKSCYVIQVGEVENLYKTTKPAAQRRRSRTIKTQQPLSLDLHGLTKVEALSKLDASLQEWTDIAMQGSYPWVIPATIVCGGGNQILSEVVDSWIRQNKNVANAPKNLMTKCLT